MSRLDELIRNLCPDGVEFRKLGEISQYCKERIDASTVDKTCYVGVENLLQNKQGKTLSSAVPTTGQVIAFSFGDILIGNIRPYLKKIWLANCNGGTNGDVLAIHITDSGMLPEFLYYVLSSDSFFHYDMQYAKGSKMPRGSKEAVLQYITPVPPLPVQRKIVRILDNFTELTAELAARKKHYEYYTEQLMNFGDNVKVLTLGEIGSVKMCKRIMKSQTNTEGGIPFYKIGTFGKEPDAFISEEVFEEYKEKYSYPKKGDILISCSGTIGRTVVFDGEPAYFQDSNIVWLEHDGTLVTNKYLQYCYKKQPWQISTGGTIARLYNDNILKAQIPVPPIEEQERIVGILDRFDALCNDLTSGLPAEIEARTKQYEYYRDKLLTFESAK